MEILKIYLPSFACIEILPNTEIFQKVIFDWMKTTTFSSPESWDCDVKSTFETQSTEGESLRNLLALPPFKELRQTIEKSFSTFYEKVFHSEQQLYCVEESWLNVYEKEQFQESHAHTGSSFSGSYYVKAPKGSGALVLEGEGRSEKWIEPKEGMVVFFEGEMPHRVEKNKSSEERISLSFNFG